MPEKVQINTDGIKKILRNYQADEAVTEYIWNGFDAGATEVHVNYEELGGLGALSSLTVKDNGSGINHGELKSKFKPFLNSDKQVDDYTERHRSVTHGKNGYGRLTFFRFAQNAEWNTVYNDGKKIRSYSINIDANTLENYQVVSEVRDAAKGEKTGTTVIFTGIRDVTTDYILETLRTYLQIEFGWFLELFKDKGFALYVNNKKLEYEEIIGERDKTKITHEQSGAEFDLTFIRWNKPLKNEYSRYYLIDALQGEEKWKATTKLNNKGDEFYHSVYVRSSYFDTFIFHPEQSEDQPTLIGHSKSDEAFKYFEEEMTKYLRNKRRPFLEVYVDQKVEEFQKGGIIPIPKEEWDIPKNIELTNVIKGLYVIQPKIFTSASDDQKKIFVRLLDTLLSTSERESILKIIDEVLGLDENDKKELLELLKVTKLSNVVRTAKLIEERFSFINQLKEVIFNPSLKANERDHLQKLLDRHFWVFGEEYSLVTTTEAKFEKALSSHIYLLRGEKKSVKLTHPDKNKEMDLFLCRQNIYTDTVENLIVEIKSPTVKLGMKEVNQLKRYQSVIMSLPECNAPNMHWKFILVGNQEDGSGYVKNEIKNAQNHGEKHKGLIYSIDNCQMYAKTWAEIFADFDCRHKFLQDRLNIDRDALSKEYGTIEELMTDVLGDKSLKKKIAKKKAVEIKER